MVDLRDAGLVRLIGTLRLAASVVCVVVGAGIFTVPAALAASVGPYAPLAIGVCALAMGSIGVCFAAAGSRIASSGGAYACIRAALGPLAGYLAGMLTFVGNVLATGAVTSALGRALSDPLPPSWQAPARVFVIVGVIGAIAWVNVGGVARATRLIGWATLVKLLPLLIFVVAGAGAMHATNFLPTDSVQGAAVGRAWILALYAFTGMETGLCANGEVANPARTIPRALALALLAITLLYVCIQVVAQGVLGAALAHSSAPLADAMAQVSPALRVLMLLGAAVSMLGYVTADLMGTPRVLFAFARDGLLPAALGRLSRGKAPHVAITCHALMAMALAISGTFAELAVLATLATTVLYILLCVSAWLLARRAVAQNGPPLQFKWLPGAVVIGIASMLAAIVLASREERLGLLALLAVCTAAYWCTPRAAVRES